MQCTLREEAFIGGKKIVERKSGQKDITIFFKKVWFFGGEGGGGGNVSLHCHVKC